jgi:hypothetical protein
MSNLDNMLFAKKELKEVFEWYAEWLLNDAEEPETLIEWMCDNLSPKALETIIHTYQFYNKED